MFFTDRYHAGLLLSEKLTHYLGNDIVVIGLARGGVVVASAVASKLKAPLDVLVVKKIGAPGNPELAIGAVAPDGVGFIDWKRAGRLGVDEKYIKRVIRDKREVIREKTLLYRKKRKSYKLQSKTVILVDDGVATGSTLEAAIKWVRTKHAGKIIVAIPVAPKDLLPKIAPEANELISLETPDAFDAVGQFYKNFEQVEDGEVVELLRRDANQRMHANATNKKYVHSYQELIRRLASSI